MSKCVLTRCQGQHAGPPHTPPLELGSGCRAGEGAKKEQTNKQGQARRGCNDQGWHEKMKKLKLRQGWRQGHRKEGWTQRIVEEGMQGTQKGMKQAWKDCNRGETTVGLWCNCCTLCATACMQCRGYGVGHTCLAVYVSSAMCSPKCSVRRTLCNVMLHKLLHGLLRARRAHKIQLCHVSMAISPCMWNQPHTLLLTVCSCRPSLSV